MKCLVFDNYNWFCTESENYLSLSFDNIVNWLKYHILNRLRENVWLTAKFLLRLQYFFYSDMNDFQTSSKKLPIICQTLDIKDTIYIRNTEGLLSILKAILFKLLMHFFIHNIDTNIINKHMLNMPILPDQCTNNPALAWNVKEIVNQKIS